MTDDIDRPLALSNVPRLMPCRAAMAESVSPALTLYAPLLVEDEAEVERELEEDAEEPEAPRSRTSPGK